MVPHKPDLNMSYHIIPFSTSSLRGINNRWFDMQCLNPLVFGLTTPTQRDFMKKMIMNKFNLANITGSKRMRQESNNIKHDDMQDFVNFMNGDKEFQCRICYNDKYTEESRFSVLLPCQHILCGECDQKIIGQRCPFCRTQAVEKIMISAKQLKEEGDDTADEWCNTTDLAKTIADTFGDQPGALVMYKNVMLINKLRQLGVNIEYLSKHKHPLDTPDCLPSKTIMVMSPSQLVGRNMQGINKMFIACFLNRANMKQAVSRIYRTGSTSRMVEVTSIISDTHIDDTTDIKNCVLNQ